jgi:hypothetical protein
MISTSIPIPATTSRRRLIARAAGAGAATLVLALAFAGHADAATTSPVNVSALQTALDALPSPTTLGTDLNNVIATIGNDAGDAQLPQSIGNVVGDLLNGTATPADIDAVIDELEGVANQNGVPATVTTAADDLVYGLTAANLEQLLGQAGSPLSPQAIQQITDELDTLQGVAPNADVPSGALSAVASGLDTIASQPNVPAAAANALEDVAGTLDSGSPISPSALAAIAPALQSAIPSLDSVPITGPALGSLVGAMGTELGAGPSGANGGAGGSGSTSAASGGTTAAATSTKVGARITKVTFSGGKLHVMLTCPATLKGGCRTTVYLHVNAWRHAVATVTMKAGAKHTAVVGLPHLASAAAHNHRLTATITATTGGFNTHNHTIHIRLATKATAKAKSK